MGYGKVAPAPLRVVSAKVRTANIVAARAVNNILRVRFISKSLEGAPDNRKNFRVVDKPAHGRATRARGRDAHRRAAVMARGQPQAKAAPRGGEKRARGGGRAGQGGIA